MRWIESRWEVPLRPALQTFYASLDDEQKARFNTMNEQQRQG